MPPTVELMGVWLHAMTESEVVAHILQSLEQDAGGWVVTPNLDHLRRLVCDERFRTSCAKATLFVPDGIPLVWASRLQRTPLPGRVAGSDLISSLSCAAAHAGRSIFLLGGNPGMADRTRDIFAKRYPALEVVGTCCPPLGFEQDPGAMRRLREQIAAAKPDIIFVALGSPKQEYVIEQLLQARASSWWLGIGISFSFVAGEVRRAPRWLQGLGLEWLHRMCQEPRRLVKRYLVDGVPFAVRLLLSSAWRGLRGAKKS
jgi:N-acetylglucosaminyldiphosphoundecaprenol N-acetyl-beta-D-mannosaminyltransferase